MFFSNSPEFPINSAFSSLDWLVLGGYFLLLVVTGWIFSKRQATTRDYFLAGGRIPAWAAAVSLLATALSAATFIGGPQQAYKGDLSYLSANIGSIVAVLIVGFFFIPKFYAEKATTVYEILERRFGPGARMAAGGTYLIGRVFASGARLYIAAIPASLIVYGDTRIEHIMVGIAVMTVAGILYTLVGGVRAAIWTDVIQTAIFTGAAIIAVWFLLEKIPAPLSQIVAALEQPAPGQPSKLTLLKWGFNGFGPKETYTLLTAIFGFSLLNLGAYGTDQDLAQRMMTCRNALQGSRSAIGGILVGLPVTAIFMAAGLLLFVFYQRPDVMGSFAPAYQPEGSREVFLTYIIRELPPGLPGLMLAGLFAAALGSLNAMSSTFVNDFYRRLQPAKSERHYVNVGLVSVIVFGLALGVFAVFSAFWQASNPETTLIDFALTVMVFAYSGLVAVYLAALFTQRGSDISAVAALVVGFAAVLLMQAKFGKSLAFPWQMTIATSLAFLTAMAGKKKELQVVPATPDSAVKD